MRHVPTDCLEATLRHGASLEQFLGSTHPEGTRLIRWIELVPSKDGIEVWDYSVPEFGNGRAECDASSDVELKPVAVVADPVQALEYTHLELGAHPAKWVRLEVTQEIAEHVLPGLAIDGATGRRGNP